MKLNKVMVMKKICAIAALLLVVAIPCQAVTVHTIRKGESLAMVAKYYYGDPAKAIFLIAYNEVVEPRHIKPGQRILLVSEPEGYRDILGDLPGDVTISNRASTKESFVQVWVQDRNQLEEQLPRLVSLLLKDGWLWVTYPKGSAKSGVDINRDTIWEYAKSLGLKAVHMISIDAKWSAMRLRIDDE